MKIKIKQIIDFFRTGRNLKYVVLALLLGIILGSFCYRLLVTFTIRIDENHWQLFTNSGARINRFSSESDEAGVRGSNLNLNAFSKVALKPQDAYIETDSITFDVSVSEYGILDVAFGEAGKGGYIFKLSKHPNMESGFIREIEGSYFPVALGDKLPNELMKRDWLKLRLEIKGDSFQAFIDEKLYYRAPKEPDFILNSLSFLSGMKSLKIDNLRLEGKRGLIFEDKFESAFRRWYIALGITMAATLFLFLAWLSESMVLSSLSRLKVDKILQFSIFTYLPLSLLLVRPINFTHGLALVLIMAALMIILRLGFVLKNKASFSVAERFTLKKGSGFISRSKEFKDFLLSLRGSYSLLLILVVGMTTGMLLFDLMTKAVLSVIILFLGWMIYSFILSYLSNIRVRSISPYDAVTYLPLAIFPVLATSYRYIFHVDLNLKLIIWISMLSCLALKFLFILINEKYFQFYSPLCLSLTILCFIFAEMSIRSTYLNRRLTPTWQIGGYAADSDLFWAPDIVQTSEDKVEFRGIAYFIEKPKDIFRIICLGGSTTWGHGIEDVGAVYPYILEELLNKKGGLRLFEVINAGIGGYTSFQGLLLLKNHLLRLDPDLITLRFGANDGSNAREIGLNCTDKQAWEMANRGCAEPNVITKLQNQFRRSRLYVGLERFIFFLKMECQSFTEWLVRRKGAQHNFRFSKQRVPIPDFTDNLEEFIRIGRENNIKVVFIYETGVGLNSFQEELVGNPYILAIWKIAQRHNIPVVDTITALRENRHQNLFIDHVHLTPSGHRVVAEEIYRTLLDEGSIGNREKISQF